VRVAGFIACQRTGFGVPHAVACSGCQTGRGSSASHRRLNDRQPHTQPPPERTIPPLHEILPCGRSRNRRAMHGQRLHRMLAENPAVGLAASARLLCNVCARSRATSHDEGAVAHRVLRPST
jgi:hypothetical protein